MAEFPALPIWTDALLGDTYHLSAAEFGAYMRLLICAWRTPECAIPDDDKKLGRMIGDPRVWKRIRPTVLAFWDLGNDGLWRQKRLTRERAFVTNSRAQKKTAADARWLKNKNSNDANACQPHMQPTPTPTPIPEQQKRTDTASPVPTTSPLTEKTIPTHKGGDAQNAPPDNVESLDDKRGYRWEGEVIKLNRRDYDEWKARFHAIPDFDAMLAQIDEHYAANPGKRKSWFHSASGWLQNEHQKRMEAQRKTDAKRQKQRETQARNERWEAMERQGGAAAEQARAEYEKYESERIAFLKRREAEREARTDA